MAWLACLNKWRRICPLIQQRRCESLFAEPLLAPITHGGANLIGRDLIDLNDCTAKEIQDLIWTALDLKTAALERQRNDLKFLTGKSVSVLLKRPCIKTQLSIPTAVEMLGGHCNIYIDDWEMVHSVADIGRFMASQSDVIFCLGDDHNLTNELADGSSVPVVNILSDAYAPTKCLVDLMTIVEHFGKLKKLMMGFVGEPGPLFNSYLTTLPRMNMNIKFNNGNAEDSSILQSEVLALAMKYSQQHRTELHQCSSHTDAIYRADIIATVNHTIPDIRITTIDTEQAALDWVFLHSLPRTGVEVSKNVFNHQRSLVWKAAGNTTWMTMAIVLKLLQDYTPSMERPTFDKDVDYG